MKLKKSIVTAFILFVVDVFVFNQFTIAGSTLFLGTPVLLVKLFRARKDKARVRLLMAKAVIYTFMVIFVFAAAVFNNKVADARAKDIIAACELFKDKNGHYPEQLSDLVPEFLAEVPSAKYSLMGSNFRYIVRQDGHALMYETVSPYGRKYYVLEKKEWRWVD
ncbi:MAG: hypothetical protein HQL10_10850 [Nitrospirae bacterium]|nr:hypothetical protein [Nitrospirota bacterium]